MSMAAAKETDGARQGPETETVPEVEMGPVPEAETEAETADSTTGRGIRADGTDVRPFK